MPITDSSEYKTLPRRLLATAEADGAQPGAAAAAKDTSAASEQTTPDSAGNARARALLQEALRGGAASSSLPPLGATRPPDGTPAPGETRADASAREELPDLIGDRYEVVEALARTGRSQVFRVRHAHLGKELALKLMDTPRADDPKGAAQFSQMAKVLCRMEHPSLVRVTDSGIDAAHGAYLVMELATGETLQEELRSRHRLPLHRAVYIVLRLADALSYVHSLGLTHHAIRAENILLCPVGPHTTRAEVKLIDFGSARERLTGAPTELNADLHGLGLLLYELITGRLPYPTSGSAGLEAPPSEEPLRPSLFLEEALPPSLEAFVLKAVAADATVRHQTMAQLMFELRAVAESLELPVSRGSHLEPRPEEVPETGVGLSSQHAVYPIFRLDRFCEVCGANTAFVEFLETTEEAVTGLSLRETRLYDHFPEAVSEIMRQIQLHPGAPYQRLLVFQAGGDRTIPLLLAVAPERDPASEAPACYTGLILPLLSTL